MTAGSVTTTATPWAAQLAATQARTCAGVTDTDNPAPQQANHPATQTPTELRGRTGRQSRTALTNPGSHRARAHVSQIAGGTPDPLWGPAVVDLPQQAAIPGTYRSVDSIA